VDNVGFFSIDIARSIYSNLVFLQKPVGAIGISNS